MTEKIKREAEREAESVREKEEERERGREMISWFKMIILNFLLDFLESTNPLTACTHFMQILLANPVHCLSASSPTLALRWSFLA